MPLFDKRSDAEKEADRQREQQAQAAQEAAKAEAARAEEERRAAAAAAEAAHVAKLDKFEYKVLVLSSTIFAAGGKFPGSGLQDELNNWGSHGWRVIDIAMSGKIEQSFAADRNDIYIVLERPRDTSSSEDSRAEAGV